MVLATWSRRDTLDNIRETGEFVVNVPPAAMIEEVMICARRFPPEVDEFEEAGLIPRSSTAVAPPGIEGAVAWMECRLVEEITREKYALVIGTVVHLEVDDRHATAGGDVDFDAARPLCMVCGNGGIQFAYPTDTGRCALYSEMLAGKSSSMNE
ncbi:MAG: flavin reductase family protein [Methanoculleus sp.]